MAGILMPELQHPQYQFVQPDYADVVLDRAIGGGGEAQRYRHGLELLSRAQLRQGIGQAQTQMAGQAASGGPASMRQAIYGGSQAGGQVGERVAQQAMAGDVTGAQMALAEREARLRAIQAYHDSRQREQLIYRQQLAEQVAAEKGESMAIPGQIIGMGASLAAGGAALSDVRAKQQIAPVGAGTAGRVRRISDLLDDEGARTMERLRGVSPDEQVRRIGGELDREDDRMMDSLRGYTYQYRPEARAAMGLPAGQRYGVMAQDLEQTPLGRTMVVDTPHGKAIDQQAATGAQLAMIGRLDERLRNIEGASPDDEERRRRAGRYWEEPSRSMLWALDGEGPSP